MQIDNKTLVLALRFAYAQLHRLCKLYDCAFKEISNGALRFLENCGISFCLSKIDDEDIVTGFSPIEIDKQLGIVFWVEGEPYSPVAIMNLTPRLSAVLLTNYDAIVDDALSCYFSIIVPDWYNHCIACGKQCHQLADYLRPYYFQKYCAECWIYYDPLSNYRIIKNKDGLFVKKKEGAD